MQQLQAQSANVCELLPQPLQDHIKQQRQQLAAVEMTSESRKRIHAQCRRYVLEKQAN
jgi:hypothetical protein